MNRGTFNWRNQYELDLIILIDAQMVMKYVTKKEQQEIIYMDMNGLSFITDQIVLLAASSCCLFFQYSSISESNFDRASSLAYTLSLLPPFWVIQ
jgi:hypothetical protein